MSIDEVPLYGRDAAIGLVHEFLGRDDGARGLLSRPTPVVLFAGPPGWGKSELLKGLARRGRDQIPGALVDCTDFGGGARELLALLAFELNRDSGRYGRVPFPRLITGLLAIDVGLRDLPPKADRDAARDRMRKALEDRKNTAGKLEATVADVLDAGIGAVAGAQSEWAKAALAVISKVGPRLVLGGLVRFRRGRRIVLGKGQEWYGHRDAGGHGNALDALIDLNRNAASTAGTGKATAADWLWDAFLADLAAAFGRRRAINWTLNCLVLLDGADGGAGEPFLWELVAARKRRAEAGLPPDPLTVVATSNGPLADKLNPRDGVMATTADASYADYQRRNADHPGWYPVSLPALSAEDVAVMASREFALSSGARRGGAASAVYRYTDGHTGTARALLNAMKQAGQADLAAVLGRARPGASAPLADELLADLLAGASARATDNLVTASAARDQEAALQLGKASGVMEGMTWDTRAGILNPTFWDGTQPPERQALHPVLRRLLLRRLAARPASSPASWTAVHALLRKISQDAGDEAGTLFHTLAGSDAESLRAVALRLASALTATDARGWLDLLEAVTAAPGNLDPAQLNAAHIAALTSWASPEDKLAAATGRLVAAMWIDADPRGEPGRREVREEAAAALAEIASDPRLHGTGVLRRYASEFVDADWRESWIATAAPARGEAFDPPRSAAGQTLLRRGTLAAAALAVIIVAGGGAGLYQAVSGPPTCGATSAPFRLITVDGECVGVTDGTQYTFDSADPAAVTLQRQIGRLNQQALQKAGYLTIALVETLSPASSPEADVSAARIDDMLRGAYIAMQEADSKDSSLPVPVRLLLANVGSSEQGAPEVVSQLKRLAGAPAATGPGRLLAIAGMGVSVQATANTAQALGVHGPNIPMFGAVTTGDDLNNKADPDLVRVVPGVAQQLRTMIPFLRRPGEPLAAAGNKLPRVAIVHDINTDDLYTRSLYTDFEADFPELPSDAIHPYAYVLGGLGPKGQFAGITRDLCQASAPPVVLYAGRESVLGELIQQLNGDNACQGKPVTIVTGSDANALPARLTRQSPGGATVTVYYSDIEPQAPSARFAQQYRRALGTPAGLARPAPWMLATYDAVTAAWNTISLTLNPGGTDQPLVAVDALTPRDIALSLNSLFERSNALHGSTGDLWLTTNGDRASPDIPVMEMSGGGLPVPRA